MDKKEKYFNEMAEQLDKITCPAFALWYMLPEFEKIAERQMKGECKDERIYGVARIKMDELLKAAKEIREIVASELW